MTYANGVGGTTPSSPNALRQNGVGSRNPPNSLDYWKKVDGRHGVTTYYWNAAPYYGLENIYSTPPGQSPIHSAKNSNSNIRRPAPFPLNLPPSATNPPPSQSPVIYNLPRVRLQQSNSNSSTGKSPDKENNEKKTPIVSTQVTTSSSSDPTKGLIWSIGSNADDRPNDQNGNPKNGSPNNNNSTNSHYAIIPTSKAQVYAQNSNNISDKKRQNSRTKPRWGRFVQSLCCCISPDRDDFEKQQHGRTNPALLITQAHKNGSNGSSIPSGYTNGTSFDSPTSPLSGQTGGFKQQQNEYMPTPTMSHRLPNEKFLLPQIRPADVNKKCLIIDLDETLVHSSFKPVKNPDFVIPVEIDGVVHQVYVLKRPYVDEFLARVGDRFECVLFTASLAKYADPVADLLDKRGVFRSRLFREACVYHKGNYVKDLARLGRDLSKTIIIDNSPASYSFHPSNAIPVQTWFDDPTDVELLDILPLLDRLEKVDSVYDALNGDDTRPDSLLERNGINS